jgi:tetratricopeptide (TPR) repeat protein
MINNLSKKALEHGGSINFLTIPSEITEGLGLTNPSILFKDGKYLLNLRHVQYTLYHSENQQKFQTPWGPLAYLNPEDDVTLRTTNYIGELNPDTLSVESFNKVDTSKLDKEPVWEFIGLEDGRLAYWDNKVFLTGVRRDTKIDGEGRMELSQIVPNGEEVSRDRIEPPKPSYCEKNWMPILDMPFHYVKWTTPTEVVKVNPKKGTSKTVALVEQTVKFPRDIRGGSQVITVGEYRIALTHEVDLWKNEQGKKDAHYYHRFIVWDKDWNIVAHSEEFKFMTANIEFSCGLAFDGSDFIIPFGFQDSTAFILRLPVHAFEELVDVYLEINYLSKKHKSPKLLTEFINDPLEPTNNFNLGEFYFKQGHTASALSFYLRAAEYAFQEDLIYMSLLMIAKCLSVQGRRATTEKGLWFNALSFAPERPEAYLFISQWFEAKQQYHEAYFYAIAGINLANNARTIPDTVDYEGVYQLQFQQAVTAWWIGRERESKKVFTELNNIRESLPIKYQELIDINLTKLKKI